MSDTTASWDSVSAGGTDDEPAPGNRRRRRILLVVIVVLVLLGLGYVWAYVSWGRSLPAGSEVQGIDISGLSRAEAIALLESELQPAAVEAMPLLFVTESYALDPVEAGLSVDVAASVDDAGRSSLNPVQILRNQTNGGQSVDAVVVADEQKLASAMLTIAEAYDRATVSGRVAFSDGKVEVRNARDGWALQPEESAELVEAAYMRSDVPTELAVAVSEPRVGQQEVDRAVQEFADPAMSAPVTVRNDVGSTSLSPSVISPALSMRPDDAGVLQPVLKAGVLAGSAGDSLNALRRSPRDASVRLEGGRAVVVPAQKGVEFTNQDLRDAVMPALTRKGDRRTATVKSTTVAPDYTNADARNAGVKEVVAEFTTYYPHTSDGYRNHNIGRAAELLNNAFLQPGEVLSFNQTVGERTPSRGFVEGGVIINDRYGKSYGGGISQLVTTTFNAAHFAGFTDVEHHPHTLYISRYPMGREATVSWGYWDLQFGNNTPHGAVVQAFISPSTPSSQGAVTVRIWSTKHWNVESTTGQPYNYTQPERRRVDAEDCAPTSPSQGFDVNVRRVVSRQGEVAIDETLYTHYDPVDEIVCVG